MVNLHHEGHCKAPVDVTFAYLDDYRNVPKWMFGLSSFEPICEQSQGLGTLLDGKFQVKPVSLTSTVEITEWEQNRRIALTAIKGFKIESTWDFVETGPEATTVKVHVNYELPGGLAGKALGKALEPIVALTIRHSDAELTRQVEHHYAGRG